MNEKEYAQTTELDNITVSYSHNAHNSYLTQTTLGDIFDRIKEDKEHKNKFVEKKLISIFPNTLDYHLSKLMEAIHSTEIKREPLFEMNIKILD